MKAIRRIPVFLLALMMLLSCITPAHALESQYTLWPVFSPIYDDYYIARQGFVHFEGWDKGVFFTAIKNSYVQLTLPEGTGDFNLTPSYYTATAGAPGWADTEIRFEDSTRRYRIEPVVKGAADYSQTQFWRFYDAKSDRSFVLPVITMVENPSETENTVDKLEAYTARVEKLISTMKQFDEIFDALVDSQNSASVQYGGRHPSDVNLACIVANMIQTGFDIRIAWPDTHSYWVEGAGWATATAEDIIKHWTTYKAPDTGDKPACNPGDKISQQRLKKLDMLLDVIAPYYLNYLENHRIVEPIITYYEVDGSRGLIDTENKTVTLRMPEDTDWNSLPEPTIITNGECQVNLYAGSLGGKSGVAHYMVTPGDRATGTWYNGSDTTGYGFKKNLGQDWTVRVEKGAPYTKVLTFGIETDDGKVRSARITDGEAGSSGTIKLNLPVGTTLTSLSPTVDYAGEGFYYTVNGQRSDQTEKIDFSQKIELVVYSTKYGTEARYDVSVTAEDSTEKDILSYKIGDAVGTISGNRVSITIPYATDLTVAEPEIKYSEFAEVTQKPAELQLGENHYTVTAEDRSTQDYIVTITRTPAATGRQITSFRYGGYVATINEGTAEITMTLPKGISPVFAPTIETSEFATVSPVSGEVQDFSSPVKYKVTAQNKTSKTYTVKVTMSDEATPNPYKGKLEQIRDNIINRYRSEANDDWEWMNLGFYENRKENYNTSTHSFDIASKLVKLNTTTNVAMTEIDRTIMMLTARGFDCSKLSQYNNGEPYIDSKGNKIDDLAAVLYNYSGDYTINGPIFALLALDMGNYSVPDNARWTREALIDVILKYGNYDEFGIDMVGAIMYSLAPYQDDEAYGARVKEKLDKCLELILRKMNSDFSFGGWGTINSESAAWVMMGLCSMGIDWNADPRFSDGQGHSALQHWMDNFANVNEGYFHHTTSVRNNALATYEGCYASQWYLKFLEGGGQGNPCYFYYHRFDFARQMSTDASITSFEIEGKPGVITEGGEGGENTITVTVPNGMPLTNLTPTVTMAEGATLLAPNLPTTFVEGVKQPFTVMAEDGKTTKTYYVTVNYGDVGAAGAELDVNSIKLQNSVLNATDILEKKVTNASDGATEILLTVNAGVDTSKMYLSAGLSYKATSNPSLDGKKVMDFSDWKTFTVTSGDKTVQNTYRIKVVSKAQAEITSFRVQAVGEWYNGVVDNAKSTITVTGVDDSKLTSTKLVTDIEFTGKTCSPTSGIAVDFANAATFTLGGDNDLASRTYTVTVLNKSGQPISAKGGGGNDTLATSTAKITGFSVLGVDGVIDQSAGTITVKLPVGTNVTAVAPVVTVPAGAVVSPVSGEVVNLTSPLTYTVTLGAESKSYTVTVIFERSISQQLWDAVAENSDVADHQTSYGHKFN